MRGPTQILLLAALAVLLPLLHAQAAPRYREGRILVKFKDGQAPEGDVRPHGRVIQRFPGLGALELILLDGTISPPQAVALYQADPRVKYAQVDTLRRKQLLPNDPGTPEGDAWHIHNDGRKLGKLRADIHAEEAWDLRTSAADVIVAVLDSGIRHTHEDLIGNMWRNTGELPGNNIDDDSNGYIDDVYGVNTLLGNGATMDDEGHGTYVAGLIGAMGDNAKGVAGVAWDVQLMACKVIDAFGDASDSELIAGLEYARRHGAHIINASLGILGEPSPALADAVSVLEDDGIILVVSAGNSGLDNDAEPTAADYPATFPNDNIVSVAATTRNDLLASFSSFGPRTVDIAAPGVDIPSTAFDSDSAYRIASGTSASAPLVAGALALLKAHLPQLTHTQLIDRLLKGAEPVAALSGKCFSAGRLDIRRALDGAVKTAANASFARALPLGDIYFAGTGQTPASITGKGLWWSWTAPFTGYVQVKSLTGGNAAAPASATVTVFSGSRSTNLSALSSTAAQVEFPALFGQTYYIRLMNSAADDRPAGFRAQYTLAPSGFGNQSLLRLDSVGAGSISGPVGDSVQPRGKKITLKARPAGGYMLYAWIDAMKYTGEGEEGILSRTPSFIYTVPDTALPYVRAIFTQNSYRWLSGQYNGLISLEDDDRGLFNLTLSASGAFTGKIRLEGKTYKLKGILRSDQRFEVSLGTKSGGLVLKFELDDERRITGTIERPNGDAFSLLAEAGEQTEDEPAYAAGAYTFRLRTDIPEGASPAGDGYGSMTISRAGKVRLAGQLPDGRAFTYGTSLYRTDYFALYFEPYSAAAGSVAGLVAFDEDQPETDLAGSLHWEKREPSKWPINPGPISGKLAFGAARYFAPIPGERILDVSPAAPGLTLTVSGENAPPQDFDGVLGEGSFFSSTAGILLNFNLKSGLFSGVATIPEGTRPFRGVVTQKTRSGGGLLVTEGKTRRVRLSIPE